MNLKSKDERVVYYCRRCSIILHITMFFLVASSLSGFGENNNSGSASEYHHRETQANILPEGLNIAPVSDVNSSGINQQPQKREIIGKVVDETGMAIPGATIVVKGTTIGVVTNFNGEFSITVPETATELIISFVGFTTQNVVLGSATNYNITLEQQAIGIEEVVAVGYGSQKKETMTGAISSVKTENLLRSPNASIANSLAGQMAGVSTVQSSGQPGAEDPKIYVRGVGGLTEGASSPLILVDGVENSFFQMDPNEIESVTVLKDASATAVFGVRGANGVILVTTRRGTEGSAKIQVSSSVGLQMPSRMLDLADSFTFANILNERQRNDGVAEDKLAFSPYELERFQKGDEPMLYPSIDWREYLMNKMSVQTQHNINVNGGTKKTRYFVSMGYLFQDGLMKQMDGLDYDNNYKYNRYNYRINLDIDLTNSTLLKMGIGGIVGNRYSPNTDVWEGLASTQPFCSPGIIDDKYYRVDTHRYNVILMDNTILNKYYGTGYNTLMNNTMNMNMELNQKMDFITKGLSFEVKAAYNTDYSVNKTRSGSTEIYELYYQGEIETPTMDFSNPEFNKTIVSKIIGKYSPLGYSTNTGRGRNWYLEGSLRYKRSFGDHNVSALALYNQDKRYYPSQFNSIPSAYVGLVGRLTYDFRSKYMAEFNIGYNGSENFAPDKRYGVFPAGSIGYILSEESFMKNQNVISYLKLRASFGLVGNDNMNGNRFLYLPDRYLVNQSKTDQWKANNQGYNFGYNSTSLILGAVEDKMGNPNVTWEKAMKQNYGVDIYLFDSKLKVSADYFREYRKDILIQRRTIPLLTGLVDNLLPVVNMGEVSNRGYEIEMKWNKKIRNNFSYWIDANMSYSKNRIEYMDEVDPNEPYMRRTGEMVGAQYGYVTNGFFGFDDFIITKDESGKDNYSLNPELGYADPGVPVYPGDVKYQDLNNDGVINANDKRTIGLPKRPMYTFGLNMGADFKGFFATLNWTGVTGCDVVVGGRFLTVGEGYGTLPQFLVDERWTPETAATAKMPRISLASEAYNFKNVKDDGNDLALRDGSYLKLKTLTIGYNIKNKRILRPIGAEALSVKFTGYNLLTFDYIKFLDPEANPNSNDTYPITKIFNLGVNVTF